MKTRLNRDGYRLSAWPAMPPEAPVPSVRVLWSETFLNAVRVEHRTIVRPSVAAAEAAAEHAITLITTPCPLLIQLEDS